MHTDYRLFLAASPTPEEDLIARKEDLVARIQKKHGELERGGSKRDILERCIVALNDPDSTRARDELSKHVGPQNTYTQLSSRFFGALQSRFGVKLVETDTEKLVKETMNFLEGSIDPQLVQASVAPTTAGVDVGLLHM